MRVRAWWWESIAIFSVLSLSLCVWVVHVYVVFEEGTIRFPPASCWMRLEKENWKLKATTKTRPVYCLPACLSAFALFVPHIRHAIYDVCSPPHTPHTLILRHFIRPTRKHSTFPWRLPPCVCASVCVCACVFARANSLSLTLSLSIMISFMNIFSLLYKP